MLLTRTEELERKRERQTRFWEGLSRSEGEERVATGDTGDGSIYMSCGGAVNSYMREEGKEKEKKRVRRRDSAVGPPPPPSPAAKVVRTTAHSDFIVGFAVSFPALCGFASVRIFIPRAKAEREGRTFKNSRDRSESRSAPVDKPIFDDEDGGFGCVDDDAS